MRAACPQCANPVVSTASRCGRCGASFKPAKADRNLGRVVGNLRLVEKLGSGGMGSVYRAEHVALGTPYAVKVLHAQFSDDDTVAERFRREAVACSRLRHENTVFVTDFGVNDEVGIYLVMEYLEGVALHQLLRREGAMPLDRFARVASQVCDAMDAAHRLGIVHRDLKPENVMLLTEAGRDGRVKVLDFGIAHLRDAEEQEGGSITRAGTVVGTPAYMSPEQIDRRYGEVAPVSDVYSLGVIFYECLAGRRPFLGDSDVVLITQQLTMAPEPLAAHRPELADARLAELVAAMLEKNPARRPQSMAVVRAMLSEAMKELESLGLVDDARITVLPVSFDATDVELSRSEFPSQPARTNPDLLRSNPSLQITGIVQRIRAEAPDSAAAALLAALPTADAMRSEAITLALWGVLQDELLSAPPADPRFAQSLAHLVLLLDAVLASHPGERPSPSQEKVFRGLKNLFTLASSDRQRAIAAGIAPLFGRPLFPFEAVPRSLVPARPDGSLVDKLRQPVSVSAVKALLTHEISLFGSKKKKSE
jgi:serine/threonine protein kinase